jgi:hypothetical protein
MNSFEININEKGFGDVKIDGYQLSGIKSIEIKSHINEISIVKIEFISNGIKTKIQEK